MGAQYLFGVEYGVLQFKVLYLATREQFSSRGRTASVPRSELLWRYPSPASASSTSAKCWPWLHMLRSGTPRAGWKSVAAGSSLYTRPH